MKTSTRGDTLSIRVMSIIFTHGAERRGNKVMRNSLEMTAAHTAQWKPLEHTGPLTCRPMAYTPGNREKPHLVHHCLLAMRSLCSARSGESHSQQRPWRTKTHFKNTQRKFDLKIVQMLKHSQTKLQHCYFITRRICKSNRE